ncbi:MAG: hypothetical protein CM15mP88_2370 [Pseudomonadota bacterium]|nr:MAG: hypothetical protein CM15mP88_2370 [Pseudomonadota bacterium]
MWLRKKVMRLLPPKDPPEGLCMGQKQGLKIIGLGESTMAGVGIPKHSETLTGLTASRLNAMTDRSIDWKILAENGLTIEQLNELIKNQDHLDAEMIMVAIGGNDVFKLTSLWKWEKQLKHCLFLLQTKSRDPLIIFSHVPPVGHFPAIQNPLRLAFGFWRYLLQASLNRIIHSNLEVHLLDEDFPPSGSISWKTGFILLHWPTVSGLKPWPDNPSNFWKNRNGHRPRN